MHIAFFPHNFSLKSELCLNSLYLTAMEERFSKMPYTKNIS